MMATTRPARFALTRLVKRSSTAVKVMYTSPATKEAKIWRSGPPTLTCLPAGRFGLMLPVREIAVFSLSGTVGQALATVKQIGSEPPVRAGGSPIYFLREQNHIVGVSTDKAGKT